MSSLTLILDTIFGSAVVVVVVIVIEIKKGEIVPLLYYSIIALFCKGNGYLFWLLLVRNYSFQCDCQNTVFHGSTTDLYIFSQ